METEETFRPRMTEIPQTLILTLLEVFSFGLSIIRDFASHGAGDVELVDVEGGLTEGRHGGVHARVTIGRTAECGQIQGFAPCDDGDVER